MSELNDGSQSWNGDLTFTALSHSIIALSKVYHEYNPFLIHTLHSLVLLNGVDCIITKRKENDKDQEHVLPVSKCDIVGIIVYCHYKANGSVVMVIDDGTDLCNCIGWIDSDEMDRYEVSNLVRVSGAIKVLALKHKRVVNVDGIMYEGWTCARELLVHSIQLVTDTNMESVHWLNCLQFRKRIGIKVERMTKDQMFSMDVQEQIMNTPVLNGKETFDLLPAKEKAHIMSFRGTKDSFLQYEGDELLLMNYFGRDCKCNTKYKLEILYCHCMATNESLDPEFIFRDAVITRLLDMEAAINDPCNDNDKDIKTNKAGGKKLLFNFASVFHDPHLQAIAKKVVAKTSHPTINVRRIYTNTFKHLRNDGIVHLIDSNADIYLFISKDKVLLPAVLELEIRNEHDKYSLKLTGKPSYCPTMPKFLKNGKISAAKLRFAKSIVARQRRKGDS